MDIETGAPRGWWGVERNFLKPLGYWAEKPKQIELRNNVDSMEVVNYSNQEAQSGISGAAAGAVLGFLVAGALGTAVGAAAGRGATKKSAEEMFRVRIRLKDGRAISGKVSPSELEWLQAFLD